MTQHIVEARSDILDEAIAWMENNSWMSEGDPTEAPELEPKQSPRVPAPHLSVGDPLS